MDPINKKKYASIFLPAPAGSVMGIGLFSVFYPKKTTESSTLPGHRSSSSCSSSHHALPILGTLQKNNFFAGW